MAERGIAQGLLEAYRPPPAVVASGRGLTTGASA
jgi:hypothetical protein